MFAERSTRTFSYEQGLDPADDIRGLMSSSKLPGFQNPGIDHYRFHGMNLTQHEEVQGSGKTDPVDFGVEIPRLARYMGLESVPPNLR